MIRDDYCEKQYLIHFWILRHLKIFEQFEMIMGNLQQVPQSIDFGDFSYAVYYVVIEQPLFVEPQGKRRLSATINEHPI
jgi:hypothetical protein